MIKSAFFAGALIAATTMAFDWAVAAPLGLTMFMRADQMAPVEEQTERGYETPSQFKRQVVAYNGSEAPGTIIIDTANTFLYLTMGNGRAIRYGIGVGRDGFRWAGVQNITKKAEWPDWTPPAEMIARQPYLPRFMAGGATNPLGARAMYLGNHDLPHPRHQRAVDHRPARLLRLHPPDQRGRRRSRQPRQRRHQGDRAQRRLPRRGSDGFGSGQPAPGALSFRNCGREARHE